MDHFGPGAELLDINSEGDVINFLGYTEKAVDVNTACMSLGPWPSPNLTNPQG